MAGSDRGLIPGGILAAAMGTGIIVLVATDPSVMSAGVPPIVGLAAGAAFLTTGLLLLVSAVSGGDGVLQRLLAALLLTAFTLAASVFPPGALFLSFIAVLAWLAVYRAIHECFFGEDPLGELSQEKQLGVGCLVYLGLVGLLALAAWWGGRFDDAPPAPPSAPPPAEAPEEKPG